MEFIVNKQFNLLTVIVKTKCLHCGLIFQYRNACRGDSLFFVDTLECNKCKKLVLLDDHKSPYKPIEDYFKHNMDIKKFLNSIEAMVELCTCGGKFIFNSSECPGCGTSYTKGGERISDDTQYLTYYLAPIRPLEDIPRLKDSLLEDIFKDVERPKTRKDVQEQLEAFAKTVANTIEWYQPKN